MSNYYDGQFADRIHQIARPGSTPPAPASGGGNGSGCVGGVAVFLVLIALRLGLGMMGSSPPPPRFNPPPIEVPRFDVPRFDPPPQFELPDPARPRPWERPGLEEQDEHLRRLFEELERL